jgi:hypothetical protein
VGVEVAIGVGEYVGTCVTAQRCVCVTLGVGLDVGVGL